jgi:hypothetical protein
LDESQKTKRIEHSIEDDEFMRKIVASEEQRRCHYPRMKWIPGQYRWFESENVIDLWRRYSAAERMVIYQRLRTRGLVWPQHRQLSSGHRAELYGSN